MLIIASFVLEETEMIKAIMNLTNRSTEGNLYYPANKAGTGTGTAKSGSDGFGLSEDMLEQYGVWIKVEPEIISEGDTQSSFSDKPSSKSSGFKDLDEIPEEEPAFSSSGEDISLEDLDIPKEEEIGEAFGTRQEEEHLSADESHEMLSSELESIEDELPEEPLDMESDDFKDEIMGEGVNEDIGMEEPIELASSEIDIGGELDDSGLDEIESVDEDTSDSGPIGGIDELPDIDFENVTDMESDEDITDIKDSETLPEIGSEEPLPELEMEEIFETTGDGIAETSDFAGETSDEEVEVPLSSNQYAAGRFDDLEHIESEIGSGTTKDDSFPMRDNSSILSKIEKELLAIKTELADIKSELASVRGTRESVASKPQAQKAADAGGFFDEEEDETIALTGDELNNILTTAEITEEAPNDIEEASESEDIDIAEETPTPVMTKKIETQVPGNKNEALRYESTPIETIELEETQITDDVEIESVSPPVSEDESAIEEELHDTGEAKVFPEESEIELEINENDFDADDLIRDVEEQEEIVSESPVIAGEQGTDDIPLEEEISLDMDDELRSDSTDQSIEDLIEKDLEDSDEISLTPSIGNEDAVEDSSLLEIEEPVHAKDEEAEVVDGIDFDLPEEDSIIAEKDRSHPSPDTELPFVAGEIEDITTDLTDADKKPSESSGDLNAEEVNIEDFGDAEVFEEDIPDKDTLKTDSIEEISIEEIASFDEAGTDSGGIEDMPSLDEADAESGEIEDMPSFDEADAESGGIEDMPSLDEADAESGGIEDIASLDEAGTEPEATDDELVSVESEIAEEVLDLEADSMEEMPLEESEEVSIPPQSAESLEIEEILPEDDIELGMEEDLSIPLAEEVEELPVKAETAKKATDIANESVAASRQQKKSGAKGSDVAQLPENFKEELKSVLSYLDQLLDTIPEDKLEEFTKSDYFTAYKKLFEELGLAS